MLQWLVLTCLLPVIWLCAVCLALFDAAQLLTLFECDRLGWSLCRGCLIAAAVLGSLVRAPAHELRSVPEAGSLHVVVRDLTYAIGTKRLKITGSISLTASEKFLLRNQNRTLAQNLEAQHRTIDMYREHNIPITRGTI